MEDRGWLLELCLSVVMVIDRVDAKIFLDCKIMVVFLHFALAAALTSCCAPQPHSEPERTNAWLHVTRSFPSHDGPQWT